MRMHCWRMVWRNAGGIAGENFADGGEAEHGVQFADACREFVRWAAAAGVLDGLNRLANAIDGVADGVGKVAIEEEKFEDAIGREVGGVDLTVGFEGRAAAEKADLFKILIAGVFALCGGCERRGW